MQVPRAGIEGVERFEQTTGIKKTRRWEQPIIEPMRSALLRVVPKINRESIGAVIVVTQTPMIHSPCYAAGIHRLLGLDPRVPVMDVNQSCDGFVYGLWLARAIRPREPMNQVLLICYDQLRFAPTPTEGLIFSDAISISVIEPLPSNNHFFLTDGSGGEHLFMLRGGEMRMDGGKVFDFVVGKIPGQISAFKTAFGPFDYLCQHQANVSMMNLVDRKTGFKDNSLRSIEEFGNQSLVSIPTALAMNEEKILGKHILLAGYGAGWCSALTGIHWSTEPVSSITELA